VLTDVPFPCLFLHAQKANIDEKAIRFPDPLGLVVALAKAKVHRHTMCFTGTMMRRSFIAYQGEGLQYLLVHCLWMSSLLRALCY